MPSVHIAELKDYDLESIKEELNNFIKRTRKRDLVG